MDLTPELVTALTATTGVIGLISLIAYLYAWQKNKASVASASSVKGIVQGEGLFYADQVILILKQFSTDDGRVQALKELVKVHKISEDKADRIYVKIKDNVDIKSLQGDRYKYIQRITSTTGPFFLLIALIGGGYDLYTRQISSQTVIATKPAQEVTRSPPSMPGDAAGDQDTGCLDALKEARRRNSFDKGSLDWFEKAALCKSVANRLNQAELVAARAAVDSNEFPEALGHYRKAFEAIP